MNNENETKNLSVIHALLKDAGLEDGRKGELTISTLTGDGSSRKFWRIMNGEKRLCLAVAPPSLNDQDLAEAGAARSIGLHLLKRGVRVPRQYGWDRENGIILFEDFGDTKLHDSVLREQKTRGWVERVRPHYIAVVERLAVMQVRGTEGFETEWCWDTAVYDKPLMLERESSYFLRAFWQEYLGNTEPSGLREEFVDLADRASLISATYFFHRDFQSRNIMLYGDEPCFIDFQGGRLGPLGYDLASLLIDPYVALPFDFQEELLVQYLDTLEKLIVINRKKFVEEYLLLALQRNLQIVGAFSFLTRQRHKIFFEQFLQPSIGSLDTLLDCELFAEMTVLRKTVTAAKASLS